MFRLTILLALASSFVYAQTDGNVVTVAANTPTPTAAPLTPPPVIAIAPKLAPEPPNEFGFVSVYSPTSVVAFGQSSNRSFSKLAFRYARRVLATKSGTLKYTCDLVPLAILRQPSLTDPSHTDTFHAIGMSPLGVQWNWRPHHEIQPVVSWTGGFLYFNKRVPWPTATQYNYTFDIGAGVEVHRHRKNLMTFMAKYNHISNGYQVHDNPGIDSISATMGFSFLK
jgi:lipid A 3-O-deacylase PagL